MNVVPARIWRAFATAGLFSLLINTLMLAPSLYMLQIYDRVLPGQNQLTLLVSSGALLLILAVLCFLEIGRSRVLVRIGMQLDQALAPRVFEASLDAQLPTLQRNPTRVFADLTVVRQFLTGNGIFALFDAPWFFIYIGVLFVLHPWLGYLGVACAAVLLAIAVVSRRVSAAPAQAASDAALAVNAEQQATLRLAPFIHVMGMLPPLRRAWSSRFATQTREQERAEARSVPPPSHAGTALAHAGLAGLLLQLKLMFKELPVGRPPRLEVLLHLLQGHGRGRRRPRARHSLPKTRVLPKALPKAG
jgi:ATP-binding cassette subfamily C exporter for protease/lipase